MQSLEARRAHTGGPFFDVRASLHHPQAVPQTLLLQTPTPSALQQAVYRGFCAPSDGAPPGGGGGPQTVVDQRFKAWLQKLRAFTDAHPGAAYHNLTDDPQQAAVQQEVMTIAKDVNDPAAVQTMALQLFQCAPSRHVRRMLCRRARPRRT